MRNIFTTPMILLAFLVGIVLPPYGQTTYKSAAAGYSQCSNGVFAIPHGGNVGWTYKDPIAHTGIPDTDGVPPDTTVPPDWDYSTTNPRLPVISHTGIDIAGNVDDPVIAVYDGVVTVPDANIVTTSPRVVIDHSNYGLEIDTYYTHLKNIKVKKGDIVHKGDVIASLASYDHFPHLHFSVKKRGLDESHLPNTFDPSKYFAANLNYETGAQRHQKPISEWCYKESHLSIALIIDSSGSMVDHDPHDLRKSAAKYFINLAQPGDQIAVVDFDDGVRTWSPLTTIRKDHESEDKTILQGAIDRIDSYGGTNIGLGLEEGYKNLAADKTNNTKAAIFLTDGQDDPPGIYRNQHESYQQKGWPIYPIGLGSDIDAGLLQLIAERTGGVNPATGKFYSAPNSDVLQDIYHQLSGRLQNQVSLNTQRFTILPGQTLNFITSVPESSTALTFSTSWPGSDVSMRLTTPNGSIIDANSNTPNVYHAKGTTFEVFRVSVPYPGLWKTTIQGVDVTFGGEPVTLNIDASVNPIRRTFIPLLARGSSSTPPTVDTPKGTVSFTSEDPILAGTNHELGVLLFAGEDTKWSAPAFTSDCGITGLPSGFATEARKEYVVTTVVYIPNSASGKTCTIRGSVTTHGSTYRQTTFNLVSQFPVIATSVPSPTLGLTVVAPTALSVVNGRYSPNPFTITATISNNGTATATGVELTLGLPDELNVLDDPFRPIGNLAVGEQRQVTWSVQADPFDPTQAATLTYSVMASGSNTSSKTVEKQIFLPAIPPTTISIPIRADNLDGFEDPTFHISGDGYHNDYVGTDSTVMTGWIFSNAPIPKGARIISAYVRFRGFGLGGDATARIETFAEDSAAAFSSNGSNKPSSRPATDVFVDWANTWTYQWQWFQTPDLTTLIQERISSVGWTSGNNIGFKVINHSGVGTNWAVADYAQGPYDGSGGLGHSVTLYVSYLAP